MSDPAEPVTHSLTDEALVAFQKGLPLATPALPGTGGAVGEKPEDFEVEEIPSFEPTGAGEHLHLWIEKRGLDSRSLFRHLARTLEVDERDIGYSGLKDTVAVTRQYVSVPVRAEPRLGLVDDERVRILRWARSDAKLRAGHLEGNHFRIVIRGVGPGALEHARAIAEVLRHDGLPNYFGPQRFGRDGDTLRRGLSLMRSRARPPRGGFLLRLALSAVQSALFNVTLAERLGRGTLGALEAGEVLQDVVSGGPFVTNDLARELPRYAKREVVPAGPMFGPRMRPASGAAAVRESELLARVGLDLRDFGRFGKLMMGTRRALVVWPELQLTALDGGLELRFSLPAGSYATVVLRELVKDVTVRAEEGDAPIADGSD